VFEPQAPTETDEEEAPEPEDNQNADGVEESVAEEPQEEAPEAPKPDKITVAAGELNGDENKQEPPVPVNPAAKKTWKCNNELCDTNATIESAEQPEKCTGLAGKCQGPFESINSRRRLASCRRRIENRPIHMLAKLIQQAQA